MNRITIIFSLLVIFSCVNKNIEKEKLARDGKANTSNNFIYEMRTYTTHPGKLDDLHNRFRKHTNGFFIKHGMTLVGYWTLDEGIDKENTLFYIIAHKDRTAAKKSWAAFINDPEWKIVYEESRENGPLVANIESQFMKPTDYSQAN